MPAVEQTADLDEAQVAAKRIFDSIANELLLVEEEFERQARSNIQVIAYIGDYLRRSGGKRVRIAAGSGGAPAWADAGPGLPPQVREAFVPCARSASMMLRMKLVTWATA